MTLKCMMKSFILGHLCTNNCCGIACLKENTGFRLITEGTVSPVGQGLYLNPGVPGLSLSAGCQQNWLGESEAIAGWILACHNPV